MRPRPHEAATLEEKIYSINPTIQAATINWIVSTQSCVEMAGKQPYIIAIIIQVIYTGMFVINKAALDHGMNSYVFIFYRQGLASLFLLPIAVLLER